MSKSSILPIPSTSKASTSAILSKPTLITEQMLLPPTSHDPQVLVDLLKSADDLIVECGLYMNPDKMKEFREARVQSLTSMHFNRLKDLYLYLRNREAKFQDNQNTVPIKYKPKGCHVKAGNHERVMASIDNHMGMLFY